MWFANNTNDKPQRSGVRVRVADKMHIPIYPLRERKHAFGTRRGGGNSAIFELMVAKVRTGAWGGATLETWGYVVNIQGEYCCPCTRVGNKTHVYSRSQRTIHEGGGQCAA